jgi:hypothetical protein
MQHVSTDENTVVNDLAQQALGFRLNRGKFNFLEEPDVLFCQTRCSGFWPMHNAIIYSAESSSTKLDGLVSETRVSRISKNSDELREMMTVDLDNWRTPLIRYLENPGHIADKKVRRQALKYVMLDNTLYR